MWSSHFPPGEFRPLSLPRDCVFAVCRAKEKGGREAGRHISQVTRVPRMEPPGWDHIVPNNVWDPTQPPASLLACLTTTPALTLTVQRGTQLNQLHYRSLKTRNVTDKAPPSASTPQLPSKLVLVTILLLAFKNAFHRYLLLYKPRKLFSEILKACTR